MAREYALQASNLKVSTNEVHFQNTGKEVHHAMMIPMQDDP